MPDLGLAADAITYSSVISALAKGKQWAAALQVIFIAMAAKRPASQLQLILAALGRSQLMLQSLSHPVDAV